VKDIFDTFDMPTEYGSPLYAASGRAPTPRSSPWRAPGAHVIGKTATTEFAFLHPTERSIRTIPAHTPGGSSSGSAAAVAAGTDPGGHRHADRRLGDPPGGLLRRCRLQAEFPADPDGRHEDFAWTLDTTGLLRRLGQRCRAVCSACIRRDLKAEPLDAPPRIGLYRSAIRNEASDAMRNAVETAADIAAKAARQSSRSTNRRKWRARATFTG
jgi:Asp-tRNA(Asn)/Glu-tRNA(Gln) amidotransferase A subunit family amidase